MVVQAAKTQNYQPPLAQRSTATQDHQTEATSSLKPSTATPPPRQPPTSS
ncbi:hypothetical protein PtB15_5B832 [Puccinia triticina]|nr:hypothetical protein PtB15_5B832 [Puccinia triticina]